MKPKPQSDSAERKDFVKLYFLSTKWGVLVISLENPRGKCDLVVGKVTHGANGYFASFNDVCAIICELTTHFV